MLKDKSLTYKIFSSSYFMMTTLTSVGYGDLVAKSNCEKLIIIPCLLASFLFLSYMISKVVEVRSVINVLRAVGDQEDPYED
jgi:hypothetical protein